MSSRIKKILIISGVITIIVVVGVLGAQYFINARPFMYAGTLETTRVIVSARVPSDIAVESVAEGDMVVAGQSLMQLSCDAQKILARQLNNDFDRASALMERGHVSVAELDVITRNKQDNDLKISWCDVVAPIGGMIISKFRNAGEIVSPGMPLFALANPYDIWAYFYVPYGELHRLRVGQSVMGVLPELPGVVFHGRIIKINDQAEFTPKNVQTRAERTRLVYGIKVQFQNPDLILKSGMVIESTLRDEK